MTKDQISGYTLKITNANSTGLVVILYEIFDTYIDEAKKALNTPWSKDSTDEYIKSIRMASQVIRHLEGALDFKYEISSTLYPLYDYVERALAKATYTRNAKDLETAQRIMDTLKESFSQVAEQDHSLPVMGNTEQVVAGMTYGKSDVDETMANYDSQRGFFA